METKRCYGCMKSKQMSPICEHCGYDERVQNATHQLPAGTVLQGKYLLGKALGQGGFGITYLGWDMALDIPVAIKEYYPTGVVTRESTYSRSVTLAISNEDTRFAENRDRFLREARTLAKLESVPEVVQVKNFFAENNTAYIVMGYVQGITLKEHMRRSGGRLGVGEVLQLLGPVLEAMGQVHALGLVHRDISPDNIMIQPNKRARLIDFGAAHAATTLGDKSTQAVLKHGFAPVEQYQSRGNLGSWTDVYAMCATIYHCITGLMPPNATDRMMGEEDFRWEALTDLTEYQVATLKRGLTISHKQRIQTMEELARGLCEEVACGNVTNIPDEAALSKKIHREKVEALCEEASPTGTIALVRGAEADIYTAPVENWTQNRNNSRIGKEDVSPDEKNGGKKRLKWVVPALACIVLLTAAVLVLLPKEEDTDESVRVPPTVLQQPTTQPTEILDQPMTQPTEILDQPMTQPTELLDQPSTEASFVTETVEIKDMEQVFENFYDVERLQGENTVTITAPYLEVAVTDERSFQVTVSGVTIKDTYIGNLRTSEQNTAEYSWSITLDDGEHKYQIETVNWAFLPGQQNVITIDDMQHFVYVESAPYTYDIACNVKEVSYTQDSITWKFKLPSQHPLNIMNVSEIEMSQYDVVEGIEMYRIYHLFGH